MSFSFPSFTRETAPMRNSCDVLNRFSYTGMSDAELIISNPEGSSGGDSRFRKRNMYIPYTDEVCPMLQNVDKSAVE
jgi:hypothetical protein